MMNVAADEVTFQDATPGINPAFDLIGLTALRNDPRFEGIDGDGVSVAVIDTGLDGSHPLLAPNVVAGRDFVFGGENPVDRFGHGTHVAGTIGATDQNIGVAPSVDLIGLQVFQAGGTAANTTIEAALEWVQANRQDLNIVAVNMSLGSGFFTSETQATASILFDDIQRLEQAGVTVVSAGGNSFKDNEFQNFGAPAVISTLGVGAVWQDDSLPSARWGDGAVDFSTGADRLVSFTQRLDAPNTVFAPGALIRSTVPGGGLEDKAGTSMASPIVAGVVALMQDAALEFGERLLQPAEIVEILRSTADGVFDGDDEDDNVANTSVSYPRIDAFAAIEAVWQRFGGSDDGGDGGGGDINATLATAIPGPRLDGSGTEVLNGRIGDDGSNNAVGAADVDLYRIELLSPGTLIVNTQAPSGGGPILDTVLRLFDAAGNQIALNNDIAPGTNPASRLAVDLPAGIVYAGVSASDNSTYDPRVAGSGRPGQETGDYALRFALSNEDPNGLISGAVPVNIDTDEAALLQGLIGSDNGAPVGPGDVDLFEIVAPDNGFLLIDTDTPFSDNFVDSFLRVFDAAGNQLAASNNDLAVNSAGQPVEFTDARFPGLVFQDPVDRQFFFGHTTDSFLAVPVESGVTYYAGVSDAANPGYSPTQLGNRSEAGTGGAYDLFVDFVNNDINGSIPQAVSDVPLPLIGQPGTIGSDSDPATGQALPVGGRDVDFVRFRPDRDGLLQIDVDSVSGTNFFDPVDSVLFVFDGSGNVLTENDDSDSFDPFVQLPVRAGTDYYVAVTGYGNDSFDPFQLASGSPGDTGDYRISATLRAAQDARLLADDTIGSGAIDRVTIGSVVFGEIGVDGALQVGPDDIDLYRFTAPADLRVGIAAVTNEEFSADTVLRVFDTAGREIAFNDDANANTRGSALSLDVAAGQELFIGINGYSPQARDYDPITGEGAAPGVPGVYTLLIREADGGGPPAVFRFFNTDTGAHFYTASEAERDRVITSLDAFDFEGPSFGFAPGDDPASEPVFRFFNSETGVHFYTISEEERDFIISTLPRFQFEGEAYAAYEAPADGTIPLYRFFNTDTGTHFYTPSEAERAAVIDTLPQFEPEGIAYYVNPLG
ncbi:MAG: S8 family serine peptidase [Alphaproteobacteria bacterium]|jgi:hypothetical protein|nr:S8 family serine peptidase [Alphaproteobacteria bacterium]